MDRTVTEFKKSFGPEKIVGFTCDVSNIDEIGSVVNKTVDNFGSLRILVANAGLNNHYGPFSLLTPVQVKIDSQIVLGTNLIGTINSVASVLPIMKKQNYGRIITLSGAGGDAKRPMPNMTIYSATKGGIVSFSKCLAEELKTSESNIKINIFQPGMIKTNLGTNTTLVNGWMDEKKHKARTEIVHENIGTDINKSVAKVLPFVIPDCKANGQVFRGFSIFKMIRGGMRMRGKLKALE